MTETTWTLAALDEPALAQAARALAPLLREGGVLHLEGDLGAGKTTFARALLRALGVGERVKSPTYSLVESYDANGLRAHHLDLYRIADPGELEWLGLDDLADPTALIVIEWPERAGDALPAADLRVQLRHAADRRDLFVRSATRRGTDIARRWQSAVAGD